MEEEFYATIKLVSGEEIISKVVYLADEDKVMLDKPMLVEGARQRNGQLEIAGFALKEWMSATFEDMFIIDRSTIITMSELDENIKNFYEMTLTRVEGAKSLIGRANKLPRSSGYLGSVKEVKKSLEDLFKKS